MEFVTCQRLIALHDQAVVEGNQLSVAHLKGSPLGPEGEQFGHRVTDPIQINQGLSQQKHPATFGVHRMGCSKRP